MNEKHIFIMKFKVPWTLLPENGRPKIYERMQA